MGLFDFLKKKVDSDDELSLTPSEPDYTVIGHSLYMDDFTGEFHQSPNGQFILSWVDKHKGSYVLLEHGKIKLQANMKRPNNGMVSNTGVFILSDWSKEMSGVFYVINANGETLIRQRCKANLGYTGISDDGLFAVFQALKSDNSSDSSKLFFFDVQEQKLLWKKCPETVGKRHRWAKSYIFDTDNKIICLVHGENRAYRYTFDGDFIDLDKYRYDCINYGDDIEFLDAVKEIREQIENDNSSYNYDDVIIMPIKEIREQIENGNSSYNYDDVIIMLGKGAKRFKDPDTCARIHRNFGEIYYTKGLVTEAISHLQQAYELNPKVGVRRLLNKLNKETNTIE